MSDPRVAVWSAERGQLSEGPCWHAERQHLLWVDILAGHVHRARLDEDGAPAEVETIAIGRHVGALAPVLGGGYLLAAGQGFMYVSDDGDIRELAQPMAGHPEVRMNDGACDPQGRFWAGTMAYDETPGAGALLRLELDGSYATVLTGLTISNGIGWSPDGKEMYLNDSGAGRLERFRFDPASGALSERTVIVQIDEPGVAPDGLTVDADGGIWVALWGGWALHRYARDGSLLERIELPVQMPTSCAFGGAEHDTLFVTSASDGLDKDAIAGQPDAGRVFSIRGLEVHGLPCDAYRGRISAR